MADVSYPIIHKEECKGCGRCVLGCSQNVIKIGSELNKAGYSYEYYGGIRSKRYHFTRRKL